MRRLEGRGLESGRACPRKERFGRLELGRNGNLANPSGPQAFPLLTCNPQDPPSDHLSWNRPGALVRVSWAGASNVRTNPSGSGLRRKLEIMSMRILGPATRGPLVSAKRFRQADSFLGNRNEEATRSFSVSAPGKETLRRSWFVRCDCPGSVEACRGKQL